MDTSDAIDRIQELRIARHLDRMGNGTEPLSTTDLCYAAQLMRTLYAKVQKLESQLKDVK